MRAVITQQNLYLILAGKAAAVAAIQALFGCGRKSELVNPDGFVLEHPAIDVADPVATAAWWCENLGFTITRQKDDETHTTFLVDASGRIAIQFVKREKSVLLR